MSNIYTGFDHLDEEFLEFKYEREEMIKGIISTLSKSYYHIQPNRYRQNNFFYN